MKNLLLLLLSLCLLASCRMFDRLFGDDIVARVGGEVLYRRDIEALNIKGFSPEDSARIVSRYVMSWAKNKLLLDLAESRLSKQEKDVDDQLEEYRRQLLVYRYQKSYVEQRLDTLILEDEYRSFYDSNPHSFNAQIPFFQGIAIKVSLNSPNINTIRNLSRKADEDSRAKLGELCYISAEKYFFMQEWTQLDFIAHQLGMDMQDIADAIEKSGRFDLEKSGYQYIVYADDYVHQGDLIPYPAARNRIKEVILSRRKQELIATLERNLLNDAMNSSKLIIYHEE